MTPAEFLVVLLLVGMTVAMFALVFVEEGRP